MFKTAAVLSIALAAPSLAQTPSAAPGGAAMMAVVEPAQQKVLRAGTEVPLRLREELTTEKKQARVGQRFQLEVASDIQMGGVIVIPAGTPATGEITEVRNKGMWGKSGYIGARVVSLRRADRSVRLTGSFDDKGVTGTAGVVGAVALVPLAGFFMTGTSARIPLGAGVKSFLDEDIVFRAVAAQPQPLEVPIAAPRAAAAPKSQR